jgi:hypothetical protein
MLSYYAILDIKTTATEEEITAAFFKKAREYHPDKVAASLKKQNRTEKEIEIITEINAKKYAEIQKGYAELTENRANYDLMLNSKLDYTTLKTEEEIIIPKTDLVNNYDEDIFNDLFIKANKKDVNPNEKTTRNVYKAYEELLEERDNIHIPAIINKFDINNFNDNFFVALNNDDVLVLGVDNGVISEYSSASIFDSKNTLSEITCDGIINTDVGLSLEEMYTPSTSIKDARQLHDLKKITAKDLEYITH